MTPDLPFELDPNLPRFRQRTPEDDIMPRSGLSLEGMDDYLGEAQPTSGSPDLPVVIIGDGRTARLAADALLQQDALIYGFLTWQPGEYPAEWNDVPILGSWEDADYQKVLKDGQLQYVIATQDAYDRKRLFDALFKLTGRLPFSVFHPASYTAPSVDVASGNIISAGCVIEPNSELGALNLLHAGVMIGSDCVIGSRNTLEPGVRLGYNVTLADDIYVGIGAVIASGISVASEAVIAPGAVVIRSVPEGAKVAGNPATVVAD
jgi:UDP-perosamine 4-acetyltransferase